MSQPDISELLAYWDTTAPLVPIEDAWHGTGQAVRHETTARIARDIRLRTEAARQVYESRLERGAEL